MTIFIGAIADDLTGATDLASMLARSGMKTIQAIGVPEQNQSFPGVDAIVIALKSRGASASEAVSTSLEALSWLRRAGARQILFKYCSTFDSTPQGNIGPVAEALLDALGGDFTIFCPALPENGRTVYQGHLFVGDRLLNESGMQNHPLTPMADSNLRRILGRQVRGSVGLVAHADVREGCSAIRAAFGRLRNDGIRLTIVDALTNEDLIAIGEASSDLPLITGGSGIALGMVALVRAKGLIHLGTDGDRSFDAPKGTAAIISGSCSIATLGQVSHFLEQGAGFALDPEALATGKDEVKAALNWASTRLGDKPIMVYASSPIDRVNAVQEKLGREKAGRLVEHALSRIAKGLVQLGVRRLVVAGGETSGAVTQALGLKVLRIGPAIDAGVPWTVTVGADPMALALKSGNFGAPDFFTKAFRCLQ